MSKCQRGCESLFMTHFVANISTQIITGYSRLAENASIFALVDGFYPLKGNSKEYFLTP